MELGQLYFFTASITGWRKLLAPDKYKEILVETLRHLVQKRTLAVYGFVIMPNHFHVIWEALKLNGKEMPHASFMKFTSHQIQKDLRKNHPQVLEMFKVGTETRTYQFWQRDSLPVDLFSPEVMYQKLEYIHNNPCQKKWLLAESPLEYKYSSAWFYESGMDDFGFLTHVGERL